MGDSEISIDKRHCDKWHFKPNNHRIYPSIVHLFIKTHTNTDKIKSTHLFALLPAVDRCPPCVSIGLAESSGSPLSESESCGEEEIKKPIDKDSKWVSKTTQEKTMRLTFGPRQIFRRTLQITRMNNPKPTWSSLSTSTSPPSLGSTSRLMT